MRRVTAGLGSLVIAAGLATTVALDAGAAAPAGGTTQQGQAIPPRRPAERGRGEAAGAAPGRDPGRARAAGRRSSSAGAARWSRSARPARPGAQAEDQYVELAREKTDKIFVVLAEFGNERAPGYPDQDTNKNIPGPTHVERAAAQRDPGAGPHQGQLDGVAAELRQGPLRGGLLRRRRARRLASSPTTSAVVRPLQRRRPGHRLGEGPLQRGALRPLRRLPVRRQRVRQHVGLIKDAIDTWVADQHAKGRTDEQIKADLASYDQWDRNDFDHDGNFNEPDGYIDHFQIVHAGGDEADGDPYQGEDAIWSHRWKAFQNTRRRARPATRTAARRSARPACGSRTTRSSPRTAACPCSRTSTATTSACRTTTTPRAARTTPSTGGR